MTTTNDQHPPEPDSWQAIGLRATLPRLKVLEVFRHSTRRHLSAEDVYRALVHAGESQSLSTVYKVLSQFEQVGVLTRSELGQSHTVYELADAAGQRHGHLLCTTTGAVNELHLPHFEEQLRTLAEAQGLELTHWALTAWGRPRGELMATHPSGTRP